MDAMIETANASAVAHAMASRVKFELAGNPDREVNCRMTRAVRMRARIKPITHAGKEYMKDWNDSMPTSTRRE
jgi:hypothetical protein